VTFFIQRLQTFFIFVTFFTFFNVFYSFLNVFLHLWLLPVHHCLSLIFYFIISQKIFKKFTALLQTNLVISVAVGRLGGRRNGTSNSPQRMDYCRKGSR